MKSSARISAARLACLMMLLALLARSATAASVSDLLVVLDADGRGYTAQQTLSSDGELVVLQLPPERLILQTVFSGPERVIFATGHSQNPDVLSLWSGSVFTRYRHRYGQGLVKPDATHHSLSVSMEHAEASVDDDSTLRSSLTWILPGNASLKSYEAVQPTHPDSIESVQEVTLVVDEGSDDAETDLAENWSINGNTLTYSQSSGILPTLHIDYVMEPDNQDDAMPCDTRVHDSELCSPDADGDEIPDIRDVCLPQPTASVADSNNPDNDSAFLPTSLERSAADSLGCQGRDVVVLHDVRFQSGQSYLDVTARAVLDRVALALLTVPGQLFEVASHTDNIGRVAHNQRLSENRADAIRHYLMLRGVSPNQLRARGYGEVSPRHDNTLPSGRRANRRVELRRLN